MTAHKACTEPLENRTWPLPSACTERDAEAGLSRNVLMLFSADASAAKGRWLWAKQEEGRGGAAVLGSIFHVAALE